METQERNLLISDIAAIYGISRRVLQNRARNAGYQKTGRDYVLTSDEAKAIVFAQTVGRPRKGIVNEIHETQSDSQIE